MVSYTETYQHSAKKVHRHTDTKVLSSPELQIAGFSLESYSTFVDAVDNEENEDNTPGLARHKLWVFTFNSSMTQNMTETNQRVSRTTPH